MKNVVIAGGGASGFTAAVFLARKGHRVTILEKNDIPLKKLLVTGNGRCNLTNLADLKGKYVSSDPEKVEAVTARFGAREIMDFFTGLGVALKSREGWIYPRNDSAALVSRFLQLEAASLKVKVKTRERVTGIVRTEEGFTVHTETWQYPADVVIVSTGSIASVPDPEAVAGNSIAEGFGLKTRPFLPALTGMKGKGDAWRNAKWAGVRVNARCRLVIDGEKLQEEEGEVQLTEYGISGIPAFQLSLAAAKPLSEGKNVEILLDFLPEMTEEEVVSFLDNARNAHKEYTLFRAVTGLLPEKLADSLSEGIKETEAAARRTKNYVFPVQSLCGPERAQVCTGGVELTELDEHLQSKKVPGLFFIGEACDVAGRCGGFNLTWAFSSAAAAASAIE